MATYGPSTGHYGRDSIGAAKKAAKNRPAPERAIERDDSLQRATYSPVVLSERYSNDYQAEINRRKAIDSGDPAIAVLTYLREQKLAGQPITNDYGLGSGSGSNSIGNTGAITASDYYKKALEEQQKAAQLRTQSALQANNAYIPQVNQYADRRLQDAYISKELNRVNMPQQLSALGYSGGATETSMMDAQTGYENRRGSIEQDRNQALGDIRQNAAQIEATGNAGLADLSANYYQNLINKQQRDAETYKADFTNTIGAYADDYMAKINELRVNGYTDDSFEIRSLMAARNKKINDQKASQVDADQQAFENYIKQQQLLYNINKPYFKPGTGTGGMSESEIISMYTSGLIDEATAKQLLGL